jgi:hypothetical protein
MAKQMKDTGTLAGKWSTRASAASTDYASGTAAAGGAWETGAKAANQAWKDGTQQAIAKDRFSSGVNGSGAHYQARVAEVGTTRYGPGVQAQSAQAAWARNVDPYLQRIKSLQLPPRGARRSPANQARANMVAQELGKLKAGA